MWQGGGQKHDGQPALASPQWLVPFPCSDPKAICSPRPACPFSYLWLPIPSSLSVLLMSTPAAWRQEAATASLPGSPLLSHPGILASQAGDCRLRWAAPQLWPHPQGCCVAGCSWTNWPWQPWTWLTRLSKFLTTHHCKGAQATMGKLCLNARRPTEREAAWRGNLWQDSPPSFLPPISLPCPPHPSHTVLGQGLGWGGEQSWGRAVGTRGY